MTSISMTIDKDFVCEVIGCYDSQADEFLKSVDQTGQLKCAMEAAAEEYIGDYFGDWDEARLQALEDGMWDAKLHAKREGEAA